MSEVIPVNFQKKCPGFSVSEFVPHEDMTILDKFMRCLVKYPFDQWDECVDGEDLAEIYEGVCDIANDHLITSDAMPAVKNLAWLRSKGWRVKIVQKNDKDIGEWWYGELYVWGPYHMTFKWTGQFSVGV